MQREDLLNAGYKRFGSESHYLYKGPSYIALYQKAVCDELGKRYFINFYEYDLSNLANVAYGRMFQCEVQFRRGVDDEQTLSSTIDLAAGSSVEDYEAFAEELFVTMGFNHYDSSATSPARPAQPYNCLELAAEHARNQIARWLLKNGSDDGASADIGDMPVDAGEVIAKHVKAMREELAQATRSHSLL